jgi:hypothetical protein
MRARMKRERWVGHGGKGGKEGRTGRSQYVSARLSRAEPQRSCPRSPRWRRLAGGRSCTVEQARHRPGAAQSSPARQKKGSLGKDALDEDGVAPEEAEELHRRRVERTDRVVIAGRLLDDQTVRAVAEAQGAASRTQSGTTGQSVGQIRASCAAKQASAQAGNGPLLGPEDRRGEVVRVLGLCGASCGVGHGSVGW